MRNGTWLILRTSGSQTPRLAKSLADAGLEVWTPFEERKLKNNRKAVLPLLPSYVFARSTHLLELLRLIEAKKRLASPHADFSLMRGAEHGIVAVADEHLNGLRTLEQKRAPRRRAAKLPEGVRIRVKQEGGSFAGMAGRVVRSGEHQTLAILDGRLKVELPTFMLSEIDIREEQVVLRRAA